MSDFVQRLVLRAAGLAAGVTARPSVQPSFVPSWGPTPPEGAKASAETPFATFAAQPVDTPEAGHLATHAPSPGPQPRRQTERPSPSSASGTDVHGTRPRASDPPVDAGSRPVKTSSAGEDDSQATSRTARGTQPARRSQAGATAAAVEPSLSASSAQDRKARSDQSTPSEGVDVTSASAQPSSRASVLRQPSASLGTEGAQPRPQPIEPSSIPPVMAESSTMAPTGATAEDARRRDRSCSVDESRSPMGAPTEGTLQLVAPRPTPPAARPTISARSEPRPTVSETASQVEVRIGTVEVRASRPTPVSPTRPRPAPEGFDSYARLRGQVRDEEDL